jgi:DNA-binding transcriptional ArsR family regulator
MMQELCLRRVRQRIIDFFSVPAVSHHLRILKKSGIISSRRDGKEVYYSLSDTPQAKLLHHAIDALFEVSCPTEQ